MPADPLLTVRELRTTFATDAGIARAVDGVSFTVGRGETVGLVGESGCGKSVTALSLLRLIDGAGRIEKGSEIVLEGRNLITLPEREMRHVRGNRIAMIWQEPLSALNPVMTVGDQIGEVARVHARASRREAREKAVEMLRLVGISAPEQRAGEYPHQLSGGMRQRVVIAMALVMSPSLLIADEPTTALDVTIQAQILDLMRTLREETGTAIMLITHDLGVVAEFADDVVVMYAGRVVEQASVAALFAAPQHPYTIGLLGSIPRLDLDQERLATIEGQVPMRLADVRGCAFAPRCPFADARCREAAPPLADTGGGHLAACWNAPLAMPAAVAAA